MNLLVEGGTIITVGHKGTVKNVAIAIDDDKIVEVGKISKLEPKYRHYKHSLLERVK